MKSARDKLLIAKEAALLPGERGGGVFCVQFDKWTEIDGRTFSFSLTKQQLHSMLKVIVGLNSEQLLRRIMSGVVEPSALQKRIFSQVPGPRPG